MIEIYTEYSEFETLQRKYKDAKYYSDFDEYTYEVEEYKNAVFGDDPLDDVDFILVFDFIPNFWSEWPYHKIIDSLTICCSYAYVDEGTNKTIVMLTHA